jgi:hypothetical protein
MEKVPKVVKFGCALGFIGGLFSIVCLVPFFEVAESAVADMGALVLIGVMFFALAGGLTKTGLWTWDVLLLMAALTIGTVCAATAFETVNLYVAAVLVVIGALIVLCLSLSASKNWANRMRF